MNGTFVKDLSERVLASLVTGFLTVTGFDAMNIMHTDWKAALAAGGGMALLSLLKGLLAKLKGNPNSASLASDV